MFLKLLALGLALGVAAAPPLAASRGLGEVALPGRRGGPQPGDQVSYPGGEWLQAARDIDMQGNRLCARLRRRDGSWAQDCVVAAPGQQFHIQDGQFSLTLREELPPGPWASSARATRREGDLLFAELRCRNLSWSSTFMIVEDGLYYQNDDCSLRPTIAPCSSFACARGTVLLPGANATLCAGLRCTEAADQDRCCVPSESCANYTWCGYGLATNPARYCSGVDCEEERDYDTCCVTAGLCSDLGSCLHGYALKWNASDIYCPTMACDSEDDRDLCCDEAALCAQLANTSGTACPPGQWFDEEAYCNGPVCADRRDRAICCAQSSACSELRCPFGYRHQLAAEGSMLYCAESPCVVERDRDTCCEAAAPCETLACGLGYMTFPDTYCAGAACDMDVDFFHCCKVAAPCTMLAHRNCSAGLFFSPTEFCRGTSCLESRDRAVCCKPAASCGSYGCPNGFVAKVNQTGLYCSGATCLDTPDRDTCCDVAAPCRNLTCPVSYIARPDLSTRFCLGKTCNVTRDLDVCCQRLPLCSSQLSCPLGYVPKGGAAFCSQMNCSLSRDLSNCCDVAMPCTNLTCATGFVSRRNVWCAGTSCNFTRDSQECCTRGTRLTVMRFTPTLLRQPSNLVVQLSELTFSFQGLPLLTEAAIAYSIGGNSPVREPPIKAFDGNTATKWLDYRRANLTVEFRPPQAADAYRFTTADDEPDRDPVAWRLEGSLDNVTFVLLGEVVGALPDVPLARFTETPSFKLWVPCLAPESISNAPRNGATCLEGPLIGSNLSCTSACNAGYAPQPTSLECRDGMLFPDRFSCNALTPR